jgi:hypothetical protein
MVAFMSNRSAKDWRETESLEDAAARLLAVLEQRVQKRKTLAGGGLGTSQDCSSRTYVPAYPGESGTEASANADHDALKPRCQSTQPREDGYDPVAHHCDEGSNGLGMGGRKADLQCVRFSYGSKRAACPISGSPLLPAERARNAPESEIE